MPSSDREFTLPLWRVIDRSNLCDRALCDFVDRMIRRLDVKLNDCAYVFIMNLSVYINGLSKLRDCVSCFCCPTLLIRQIDIDELRRTVRQLATSDTPF